MSISSVSLSARKCFWLFFFTQNEVNRSHFSNTSIFTILVDEINYLQKEGLEIQTKKALFIYLFCFRSYFTESFNATYFCRFCKISKNDSHLCSVEKTDLLRTEQNLNNDLLLNNIKETSVKENNKMHDFDEEVYKYGISHILYHYIYNIKNVSFNTLNEHLKEDDVKKKRLSFSASEMNYFLLLFPFIIGEDVCHDDVWKYYLILRKIHDLVNVKISPKRMR
ncbi:hypothetical protein ACFW04_013630 [Cataglyphis niger]